MQNDLRAELIKQFPAEVLEMPDENGEMCYVCPTCKRPIAMGNDKCIGCNQVLNWDHIRRQEAKKGLHMATLSFEIPSDFSKGDCRRCPLSYIAKENNQNVYQCPLKMRTNCKLELS